MSDRSFHESREGGRIAGPTVLILVLIAIVTALAAAQKADIKTEDGVRVVRNPKTPVAGPGGKPATVSLVEDLVIGNDTSRENYWFGFLNSLAVDDAGRIYTLDPKDIRVRVFGPDGTLIRAFGRAGQGPGEFSGPGGILVAPDGTIVVTDVLNGRISYFTPEGAHLKDTVFGTYRIAGLEIDGHSNLFITSVQPPSEGTQVWELLKLDRDMKPLFKFHSLAIPFRPRTMALIPTRLFYGLALEDGLAWMVSTEYEIHVADAAGKTVMDIIKENDPRKFTQADREGLLKDRFRGGALPQIEIQTPDHFPAASGFMTDDKGRIYVRTYESDGRGGVAMDVFDPAGFYIARFFVPEGEDDVIIRNDKLYSIVNDPASGNPLVKRYALKWK